MKKIAAVSVVAIVGLNLVAANTNWVTHLEETFADIPDRRFKLSPMSPPGTTIADTQVHYDKIAHRYTVQGYAGLTRPVSSGPDAQWDISLTFPEQKVSPVDVSFSLILMDGSTAGIQIQRNPRDKRGASVRFIHTLRGQDEPSVLREFPLAKPDLDGDWHVHYRHGLLSAMKHTNIIGLASIQRVGIPIGGLFWLQQGGKVACDYMKLQGETFRRFTPEQDELRTRAAGLNREAQELFGQKLYAESLSKMSNAAALYLQANGTNHSDSGNAFLNLASITEAAGRAVPAEKLFEQALAIHETVFGPNHPTTTQTRFKLGQHYFDQGQKDRAKQIWTRCRDDWKTVFGPEYPKVTSLDVTLRQM